MSTDAVMDVFHYAMLVAMKIAAPILLISMGVGLIISIFQAATQIHEQTLTFVPKLIAIAVILVLCGGWMMSTISDFYTYIMDFIVNMG